jgi:hypothetical protein
MSQSHDVISVSLYTNVLRILRGSRRRRILKFPVTTRYTEISIGDRKNYTDFLERNIEIATVQAWSTRRTICRDTVHAGVAAQSRHVCNEHMNQHPAEEAKLRPNFTEFRVRPGRAFCLPAPTHGSGMPVDEKRYRLVVQSTQGSANHRPQRPPPGPIYKIQV